MTVILWVLRSMTLLAFALVAVDQFIAWQAVGRGAPFFTSETVSIGTPAIPSGASADQDEWGPWTINSIGIYFYPAEGYYPAEGVDEEPLFPHEETIEIELMIVAKGWVRDDGNGGLVVTTPELIVNLPESVSSYRGPTEEYLARFISDLSVSRGLDPLDTPVRFNPGQREEAPIENHQVTLEPTVFLGLTTPHLLEDGGLAVPTVGVYSIFFQTERSFVGWEGIARARHAINWNPSRGQSLSSERITGENILNGLTYSARFEGLAPEPRPESAGLITWEALPVFDEHRFEIRTQNWITRTIDTLRILVIPAVVGLGFQILFARRNDRG